jgi:hypothetical protein
MSVVFVSYAEDTRWWAFVTRDILAVGLVVRFAFG